MATLRPFDVIFCRNVLIYFDLEAKQQVVESFNRVLRPGGEVFIIDFPRDSLAQRLWNEDYFRAPEVEALGDVDWFYDQRGTLIRPELVNEVGEDADDTDEGPEE